MASSPKIPAYLVEAYRAWHKDEFTPDGLHRLDMANQPQHPRAMFISCCDSRVQPTALFGLKDGDAFVHRSIAGLVAPYAEDSEFVCTPAALEFAIGTLEIGDLFVLGHSGCGGVRACKAMCERPAGHPHEAHHGAQHKASFVDRWVKTLCPAYPKVSHIPDDEDRATALEHEAVVMSLENLTSFPFIRDALDRGALALHGMWHDIASGALEVYDAQEKRFIAL